MIRRAAVVGAGTMGAGIAAHIASTGVPVVLLDLGEAAHAALHRLTTDRHSPLVTASTGRLITAGSVEDELDLVADADWIVEAVVEDVTVKRDLYERLEHVRKRGSIVSSNTSTLPLSELLVAAPESLVPDFLITHFFNPPRTMRLLELVAGAPTRAQAVETVTRFADLQLGKTVVRCNDTPAFIANRVGCFWIACAIGEAIARGLTVEDADAALAATGVPRTGVFGLMDLIGIPLYQHLAASLARLLPRDDPWRALPDVSALFERMSVQGLTGRASGRGFYARGEMRLALDLESLEYRVAADVRLPPGAAVVERADRLGDYARSVLAQTIDYAARLVPHVTDRFSQIDLAMELGFGWRRGPFALADELGPARVASQLRFGRLAPSLAIAVVAGRFYDSSNGGTRELAPDGRHRPIPPAAGLALADVKQGSTPLVATDAGSLWSLGDGAACLELRTKLNALDPDVFELIHEAIAAVAERARALVVHSDGPHFSAGADLKHALGLADADAWEELMLAGQRAFTALERAPFPVVAAPSGMCLGGGCELLLHCDAIQAHTETYVGLVENTVGIVPGWGGCKEMLLRAFAYSEDRGPMPPVRQVFDLIRSATVSTSADHARELGFLRPHDRISRNRDRLLADAKALALELADGYTPRDPVALHLPGASGRVALLAETEQALLRGRATEHDRLIATELARVLTGGDVDVLHEVSEENLLSLERRANRALATTQPTRERIAHMLETSQPLRN